MLSAARLCWFDANWGSGLLHSLCRFVGQLNSAITRLRFFNHISLLSFADSAQYVLRPPPMFIHTCRRDISGADIGGCGTSLILTFLVCACLGDHAVPVPTRGNTVEDDVLLSALLQIFVSLFDEWPVSTVQLCRH